MGTLLRPAFWRHERTARLLDYADRGRVWRSGWLVMVILACFAYGSDWTALFSGLLLGGAALLFRQVTKNESPSDRRALHPGLVMTIGFVEFVIWADSVLAGWATLNMLTAGFDPKANPLLLWSVVSVNLVYSYLLVDLLQPPRERKRIKVRRPRLAFRLVLSPRPA